jgi:polysaccharide chain length determinant protein (PEP-CTERM system associated)
MSAMDSQFEMIRDEIRGSWRFRWIAVVTAWAVALLIWAISCTLPDVYEGRTRVYVETSTALRPLLQGLAVQSNVQSQLDLVRQGLPSRPSLEKVAEQGGLLARATTPQAREAALDSLKKNIDLSVELAKDSDNYLYTIAYRNGSRDRSVAVTRNLLDTFIENVLGQKRMGQESAQAFLQTQISDYERRLSEAEARLAAFKKKNLGLVPGEQGDFFSRLQAESEAAEKARTALQVAETRRAELVSQLQGQTPYTPVADSSGMTSRGEGGALDTTGQLQEAETKLQELLLRYTDRHPEVIALRGQIDELRARRQKELEALRQGRLDQSGGHAAYLNPVYQRIQTSLNETNVEVAALRGELGQHQRRMGELRKLADTAPEVEAEYARLNRDYGVTKAQYQSMVERLEQARITDKADETGAVKFNVIDPPVAKLEPVAPKRGAWVLVGMLLGLIAGCGAAYVMHLIRPVFQSARALAFATGLPVLGTIAIARPEFWKEQWISDARKVAYAFGGLVLLAGIVMLTEGPVVAAVRHLVGGA